MTTRPNRSSAAAETEPVAPMDVLTTRRSNQQSGLLSRPICDALRRIWICTLCCVEADTNRNQNPGGAPA